jgi:hypothetical protein
MASLPRPGRILAARALAVAAVLLLGCVSPTLPLPPPALPTVSAGPTPGTVRLTSINGANPKTIILIVNRNESLPGDQRVDGTLSDENGSWDATVVAKANETLDIYQESGSLRSPPATVTIR